MDETTQEQRDHQKSNRDLVATLFLSMLVATSFTEMMPPFRTAMRSGHFSWADFALATIFYSTTLRFFLGNQLHLVKLEWANVRHGHVWFGDFLVVAVQHTILIFMASLSSVEENNQASFDMLGLWLLLMVIDIAWYFFRRVQIWRDPNLEQVGLPPQWSLLNGILAICLALYLLQTGEVWTGHLGFSAPQVFQSTRTPAAIVISALALAALFADPFLSGSLNKLFRYFPSGTEFKQMTDAVAMAKNNEAAGGFPAAALIFDGDALISSGVNSIVQQNNPNAHSIILCIDQLPTDAKRHKLTIFTTSMPCEQCAGKIIGSGIKKVVVGTNRILPNVASRKMLEANNIEVTILKDAKCEDLLQDCRTGKPGLFAKLQSP